MMTPTQIEGFWVGVAGLSTPTNTNKIDLHLIASVAAQISRDIL